MKRFIPRLWRQLPVILLTLLISVPFIVHVSGYHRLGIVNKLENLLYDARIILTMPGGIDDRIVIVDIDEKSLSEIGRWPWSRDRVAKLIDELFNYYEVAVVGLDIFFPEPDESSGFKILEVLGRFEFSDLPEYKNRIEELRGQLNYDKVLAESMNGKPIVLGLYFKQYDATGQSSRSGVLPPPAFSREIFEGKNVLAREAKGYGANLLELQNAAAGAGHVTPEIDEDGVVRRVPMVYEFLGSYYEALSLAVIRTLFFIEQTKPIFADPAVSEKTGYPDLEALQLDFLTVPVDKQIQALVPYRGRQGSFPYVSAADILQGTLPKEKLQGRIILVGTTAPGQFDLRTVPMQKVYAGVEVHANLIAGIMDQNIKSQPAYTKGIEFIQIIITALLLAVLLPLLSPIWLAVTTLATLVTISGINYHFWNNENLVIPLGATVIMIACIFLLNMSYGFFVERRSKKQIASTFGQYVPPELVDEMNFDPKSYTLDAESRDMTVLFSDVRSFTTISEGLEPAELSELMNAYLTPMTSIIHEHRGTIDKYIGDAVMAFWGAPIENPEHARYALRTGLEMLERVSAMRHEFRERGWPELHIGIGLNTGVMSVGNMGSRFRMSYTVLGDAVNLGARLEGLTKNYGVEIIVSEFTRNAVPEYTYRELDLVRVKGKLEPIGIYEPIALTEEMSNEETEELTLYDQALKVYRQQNWELAETQFQHLQSLSPERKLYEIYLERIETFKTNPPEDNWDGVYTHTSK